MVGSTQKSWGWCSNIDVIILPEIHLSSWLSGNILSISVAHFSVTLAGRVISGMKLFYRRVSRN